MFAVFRVTTVAQAIQSSFFEKSFVSHKVYSDPFNDVEVDVVFVQGADSWRVPAFWRGGSRWTVRFAPPTIGEYTYHLESTDKNNADLNGHETKVLLSTYKGPNPLLTHGMLRVSANKRYFEYEDGTPFFWLGDTWWTGLSDRLPWEGFQRLAADRKAKGFTVIQITAGLIPNNEEQPPIDPGYRNEGGAVWDPQFKQINPRYFDFADRRIAYLFHEGLTPALVGAWGPLIFQMGEEKLKKHWRYLIARYSAYPILWIAGGEVYDPPEEIGRARSGYSFNGKMMDWRMRGWSDVARYLRATDPYHHPVSVHDAGLIPPLDDESLTDYYCFQTGHENWSVIPIELGRLQTDRGPGGVKPKAICENGYEQLFNTNLEDFQRATFWLAMLNGAQGYTYGAGPTYEVNTAEQMHRVQYSMNTWEEGMRLPGSYQDGIAAKLLRQYPWWQFEPHREWVSPRGDVFADASPDADPQPMGGSVIDKGNFFMPYAAGVPRKVRLIYLPPGSPTPTVQGLEEGVHYHAFYWDPSLGIKFDLGAVERLEPGAVIAQDDFSDLTGRRWTNYGSAPARQGDALLPHGELLSILSEVTSADVSAAVDTRGEADAGLVLRFEDADNFVAAVYSAQEKSLALYKRKAGADGPLLAHVPTGDLRPDVHLSAEVHANLAAASITDGTNTISTPIVQVDDTNAGAVGLLHTNAGRSQSFRHFEVRESRSAPPDAHLERKLYDAEGRFRGELRGGPFIVWPGIWNTKTPGWDAWGREKQLLLDEYLPPTPPYSRDWVLVLDATH